MKEPSMSWQAEWREWTGFDEKSGYDLDESSSTQRRIAEHFFGAGVKLGIWSTQPPKRRKKVAK